MPEKSKKFQLHPAVVEAQDQCYAWRNIRDYKLVHAYWDSIFASNTKIPETNITAKYLYLADMYTNQLQDYSIARTYLDSAERSGFYSPENAIMFYFLKGFNSLSLRKYEEAFEAYHRGKRIIDSTGDQCRAEAFYQAMAYLHFRQEKYADALNYYKLRRNLYYSCDSSLGFLNAHNELMSINNIGLCFERMGLCDSAVYYYSLGIDVYYKLVQPNHPKKEILREVLGVLYGNLGGCLLTIGNLADAEIALKKSIEINYSPNHDIKDAILTRIKLADLYLQKGETELCKKIIDEINTDNALYPNLTSEQRLADLTSRYYEKNHNFESALFYNKKNFALKDSVKLRGQLLDAKYDFINEIEQLRKEMDLVKLKDSGRRKNNIILITTFLFLIGLVITLNLQQKRKQEKKYLQKVMDLNRTITQNNQKLQNSLSALEQSQSENSRIMRILAHDLRSPIAGIVNAIRVLKHNHLQPDESQKILDLIEKSSLNSLDFVDDLLNLNEDSDLIPKTNIDLSVILDTCIQLVTPQMEMKGITLQSQLIPVIINANQQRIWRVFNNILNNAIKFTPEGKAINIKTHVNDKTVKVCIQDQGIGIPDHLKDKIFTMFSEAGRPGTEGEKSFGLGLALSKQIIESHHGRIWFEGKEGEGTEFCVELPIAAV